jgi:hypothetical protein
MWLIDRLSVTAGPCFVSLLSQSGDEAEKLGQTLEKKNNTCVVM